MTKSNLGTTRFILLMFSYHSSLSEESGPELINQDKSLGAELTQRHGLCCSLACPHALFILLPYSNQDLQPRDGTAHRELSSRSVTALQAYLQPHLIVAISQLRVPPLRRLYLWVVGIKLTLTSVIPKRRSLTESSLRDSHPPLGDLYTHKDVLSVGHAAEHKVHSPFTYSSYTRREGHFHGTFNSLAQEPKLYGIRLLTYGVIADLKRLRVLNLVLSFEYRMTNCISCGTEPNGIHKKTSTGQTEVFKTMLKWLT